MKQVLFAAAIVASTISLASCQSAPPTMNERYIAGFPAGHSLNPGAPPPGVKPVPDFKVEKQVS